MNKSNLSKLLPYIKKHLPIMMVSLFLSLISSLLTLLIPYLVGQSLDLMVDVNEVYFDKIFVNIIVILISAILISVCLLISSVINNKICFAISRDLRKDLNDKIHKLPLKYLDNNSVGEILNRIIVDVETISDGLILGFNQLFSGLVTMITCLVIMFVLNYLIALVVLVLTPLSLLIARFITKSTYSLFKKQSQIKAKQSGFINEMITSMKVVQAFNHEKENEKDFDKINDELEKVTTNAVFFSSLVNPSTRFINAIVYAGVALVGALIAIDGGLKAGMLVSFLAYVNQYTKPFNEITGVISELQNSFASMSRVFDLLEEKEELKETDVVLENVLGDVEFENVTFFYEENKPLIQNLSLKIKKGTKVAIVGPTGCGKTTLINLLMRFYDPIDGRILIDGKDITKVTRKSLRDSFGMVLQDTYLKEGTIKENVSIGKKDASEEEILNALKESYALSFVNQMSQGINTFIKEDGGSLSQGQKQLLCVSRIMLTRPPILILDEATSSIDTRTEIKIQKAFHTLMEGKTSFIVAHRLSTIKNADLILVMNKGNVIEQGTHEELLALKGFYCSLYNSQFK